MYNSLEVRVPFLDTDVVEYAMSLPTEYKITRSEQKRVLKRAFEDRLPDAILEREFRPRTEFSITDPETLREELLHIREDGIAYEDEENVRGIRGVGAAIESPDGDVLGAVAVSGPVTILDEERFENTIPELVFQTQNFIEVKISLDYRESLENGSHVPKDFY
jgi:hypothetical protein